MQDTAAYPEVNRHWKATAKVLFGGEVGGLDDYAAWLGRIYEPRSVSKSSVSGKEVVYCHSHYPENSLRMGFDEIDFGKKYAPLSINSLKDIDSLFEAVSDRAYYTGNVILGDSKFIEAGTNVVDSFYAYRCTRIGHAKYLGYCTQTVYSENVFGSSGAGQTSFCIRPASILNSTRCFEISKCDYASDCYYSHGLTSCKDCIFCFNLRSKRNCIGNLQLPPEKYAQLKAKLAAEMHGMLIKGKRLPTLFEIAAAAKPDYSELKKAAGKMGKAPQEKPDKAPVEKAFADTTKILLGKPLGPIDAYSGWLQQRSNRLTDKKSCASGKPLILSEHADFLWMPSDRLISLAEADFTSELVRLLPEEAAKISMQNAAQAMAKIAFFCPEWQVGTLRNNIDCPINSNAVDCYRSVLNINAKLCACNYWARDSECLFGVNEVRSSSFCMDCYHSEKLTRCFEVDASRDCSDCYFCHNCENVHDSMFCFNVKNMRNAIGNVELPREKYLEVKKRVLAQLSNELSSTGSIRWSIFGLGQE